MVAGTVIHQKVRICVGARIHDTGLEVGNMYHMAGRRRKRFIIRVQVDLLIRVSFYTRQRPREDEERRCLFKDESRELVSLYNVLPSVSRAFVLVADPGRFTPSYMEYKHYYCCIYDKKINSDVVVVSQEVEPSL